MLLVVAAQMEEARPLIARLGLTRRMAAVGHQIFERDDTVLIISGPGKVAAATATARILAGAPLESTFAVNICAASFSSEAPAIALAAQIRDAATGRAFFPDQIIRSGMDEITLTTVERGQTPTDEWVDGESAGFFESAAAFLPPSRIAVIAIARGARSDSDLAPVFAYLDAARHFAADDVDAARELFERLKKTLRLTESQLHALRPLLRVYLDGRTDLSALDPYLEREPTSSQERNERYTRLSALLAA